MNSIAVEVEISIVGGANGIPLSFFDPNHPFLPHNFKHPLPYWECENKFHDKSRSANELSLLIEEELIITPSLDLQKAFNCFSQVATTGAKYTLKLCVDVPDNKNPLSLPPQTGSETGHTFVVLTKSNGNSQITQVFGFYAVNHPGYLFPFRSLPSVIKNNQLREINASIEMILTEAQFEIIRKKALELARHKYAAADYNCTNFSLDLFNSVRTAPLTIDSYVCYLSRMNETDPLTIDKTPQMLFKKLKQLKDSKNNESSHINIDQTGKIKAPLSHGECN